MQSATRLIIEHDLAHRYIRTNQLDHLIGGTAKRRYGLVNRAIKAGELIQIQRGLYIVADQYRNRPHHPFALAQAIVPGSYVSFETALAHHGWIPEKVFTTASVLPGRQSRRFESKNLGVFNFHPLALHRGYFLELVNRYRIDEQSMLVAEPFRALMDLVCLRKIEWKGVAWLVEGMRIDASVLNTITREHIQALQPVYKHKRVRSFLSSFSGELGID